MKPAHSVAIEQARKQYQDEDIQIDPNAQVAETDDGVWVSAWVYVPKQPDDSHEEFVHELELVS